MWEICEVWASDGGIGEAVLRARLHEGWEPYAVLYEARDGQRGIRHFLRRQFAGSIRG